MNDVEKALRFSWDRALRNDVQVVISIRNMTPQLIMISRRDRSQFTNLHPLPLSHPLVPKFDLRTFDKAMIDALCGFAKRGMVEVLWKAPSGVFVRKAPMPDEEDLPARFRDPEPATCGCGLAAIGGPASGPAHASYCPVYSED